MCAIHGYRLTLSNGAMFFPHKIGPRGKETGLHLGYTVRIEAVHAQRRWMIRLTSRRSFRADRIRPRGYNHRVSFARILVEIQAGWNILKRNTMNCEVACFSCS